jgi:hypothetical protein
MVEHRPKLTLDRPATYRISVQGYLGEEWSDYLQGMIIATGSDEEDHPVTVLTGPLLDQSALLSVLNGLYNYRLPLISVELISVNEEGGG